ncbi:MAG TPA: SDR family NAD(P)-dependent oxidoreductase, partial [Acidobacteriota bacterium]|nr:SDR family NAD(P)-dependent oxidoreductase [Acidobacteriota bacterium]
MRLEGKVAVITGAGSGIGRETALLFAAEGARIVIADVNDAAGEGVAAELQRAGKETSYIHADVSSNAEVERLIQETEKKFGKLDIMMNNAG